MTPTRDPRAALVAWRASTGYSRGEVGALFQVTKGGVAMWEKGHCRVPRRVQLRLAAEGWLSLPYPQRRPLNHTPMCPASQPCRSCACRRWRQTHAANLPPPRPDVWTAEHEARLTALAGQDTIHGLAVILTAEFGVPRTAGAIHTRLVKLGLSCQTSLLGVSEIAYWCAVSNYAVERWIASRVLVAEQPAGPGTRYVIRPTAFEAFLQVEYPRLAWQRMPPSRWRNAVEMLWRRDPVYTLAEAARWAGVSAVTLRTYCQRGELAAERVIGPRSGRPYLWRVRRSALARFQVRRPASLGNRNSAQGAA